MHKSLLTILTLSATTLPVLAMGASHSADTNGDGMLSVEEVQAAFPDISTDMFMAIDTDSDGLLSEEEVAAAQESGMMPASDG